MSEIIFQMGIGMARANVEPISQSFPGQGAWKSFNNILPTNFIRITNQSDIQRPPLRSELGFIRGVITRKGQIAAGQHVVCLDSRFNLIAETVSAADGSYRFDSLNMYDTYIIIAQDNFDFKYAPVGADRRTPEAYS